MEQRKLREASDNYTDLISVKERGKEGLSLEMHSETKALVSLLKIFKSDRPAFPSHGSYKGNIIILNRNHLHFELTLNLKLLGDLIKFNENHSC